MVCPIAARPAHGGAPVFVAAGLAAGLVVLLTGTADSPERRASPSSGAVAPATGQSLYVQHCAACHGEAGDGNGPAARFLYPRPRNFGEAKFRVASTENSIPTDDDLMRVITRGMPGSSMFPFGHLSEAERRNLVAYVRERITTSFIANVKRQAAQSGEQVDAAELARDAAEVLKPGGLVAIPTAWPRNDDASRARGKALYLKTCAACHGESGKGDGQQVQKNLDGTPTAPRDFTRGIFKGGREREQLYIRIAAGMAGTPMPATEGVPPEQICDLVHFVHSLAPPDAQTRVEHRRQSLVARRSDVPLGDAIPASAWSAVAPTAIVVSPLWWRNYAEPNLRAQALHDGRVVTVRLTWRDETRNERIAAPDDFEDMAAVQLFAGAAEPFIGMGAADALTDLWLWRASWQKPRDFADSILDDYPFESANYRERFQKLGRPLPDFQTARAAGNPHARTSNASASQLAAKGFGSTTFLPRPSQVVAAKSHWSDGVWTVEFRRPLAAGDGVGLAPGSRCSIAFALWDGAAHDRNGQKLVSIWHDLVLDP